MLRQYQLEIAGMRAELALPRSGGHGGGAAWRCCNVDLDNLEEPVALDGSKDLAAQVQRHYSLVLVGTPLHAPIWSAEGHRASVLKDNGCCARVVSVD